MTTGACDPIIAVTPAPDIGSDDIDRLRAALAAEQMARREAEARASGAETMEAIPGKWKVGEGVREKFTGRACETIPQPPAPFHPISRGRAGANLLAMVLDAKFANHLPLNRQSEAYAREGIDLDVSTLADWVGACTATLAPLFTLMRAHVMAGERPPRDGTTAPPPAPDKTIHRPPGVHIASARPL